MMLADFSGWTLVVDSVMALGTMGALVIAIIAVSRKQEVKVEQPLQTQKIWPSATVGELRDAIARTDSRLDKHEEHIAEIREIIRRELPEMERRIAAAGEGRVLKIHERINEVLAEVSKIEGYCQHNHGIKP